MIYSPTEAIPSKLLGKYSHFTWTAPNTNDVPFLYAAQEIMHFPSYNLSFHEKNLFWNGLNENKVAELIQCPYNGQSFETLMRDRANQLADRAENMGVPVYILWSGGIDSTAVLLACRPVFEKRGIPYKVVCTPLADGEYGKMYRYLKEQGVTYVISHIGMYDTLFELYQEGIVTSGYCGDQLGSSTIASVYGGNTDIVIRYSWQKCIMQLYPDAFDAMDLIVQASGLQIQNAFELGWLLNLLLKWDFVSYNAIFWSASSRGEGARLPLAHNFPFFGSLDFRLFGIDYFKKYGLSYKNETRPFTKKFILDNTGDEDYFKNKCKEATMFDIRPNTGAIEDGHAVIHYALTEAVRVE